MDLTLLQALATLGPGFVLAGIVIMWKRADDARFLSDYRELVRKQTELAEKSFAIAAEHTRLLQNIQESVDQLAALARIEQQIRDLNDARRQARQ